MASRLGRRVAYFASLPIKLLKRSSFSNIREISLKTIPSTSKRVLESRYGFEVDKVRTLNMDGKKNKRRGTLIAKPDYKNAYGTLKNPFSISPDLYPRAPQSPPPGCGIMTAVAAAAAAKSEVPNSSSGDQNSNPSRKVWFYSLLLGVQCGIQPLISKRCTGREVIVTSLVLTCEIVKVICALLLMAKDGTLKKLFKEWTLVGSLTASGLPAAIYALQNSLLQISYRNLDSLMFSMLYQSRLCFTAFFTSMILRQKQSIQQIGALFMLILAAVFLSIGEGSSKASSSSNPTEILFLGIIPVMVASVLSGLASALCQWATQVKKHTSYLMTVEMSIIGSLCLMASFYKSPDGEAIIQHGFFYGWTPWTLIPVLFNAIGGILVGLVTSYAGGVRKGFVIISALLVTALLQFVFDGKPPSFYCLVALPLVISSVSIYQKYPYRLKAKEA